MDVQCASPYNFEFVFWTMGNNKKSKLGHTKQHRIEKVGNGGGHIVILGAGASVAATLRDPLPNGKRLPLMKNFIKVVGLQDIIMQVPEHLQSENFETLYSNLWMDDSMKEIVSKIDEKVYSYFKDLQLPDKPTIYDYLVLALRKRDLIATFNWDPLLFKAWNRSADRSDRPFIAFLHGNVAIGYSDKDKTSGPAGMYSQQTRNYWEPTKLLYPVKEKNYDKDEYIESQWAMFKDFLQDKNVVRVTVFGYGAPNTDVLAMETMLKAWGGAKKRNMEQFEIIDVRDEKQVVRQWTKFIDSHHYDFCNDYFKSSLAWNPRRTSESYFDHYLATTEDEAFSASNPVPSDFSTLQELYDWHKPLLEAEQVWRKSQEDAGN